MHINNWLSSTICFIIAIILFLIAYFGPFAAVKLKFFGGKAQGTVISTDYSESSFFPTVEFTTPDGVTHDKFFNHGSGSVKVGDKKNILYDKNNTNNSILDDGIVYGQIVFFCFLVLAAACLLFYAVLGIIQAVL